MNEQLRSLFGPFFLYSELRTLFICLRRMKDRNTGAVGELLDLSLLSNQIKKILSSGSDISGAVRSIERLFRSLSPDFTGLERVYEAEGLRGVEQRLTNTYLSVTSNTSLHPVMKKYFARMIDARNIMSMYKQLRLEQKNMPFFIPGGTIPAKRFRAATAKEGPFGVCSLIREFFHVKIDTPDPTRVEIALYKGITAFLKKEGREPFGAGPILYYLWKCSLEVMNLNVLNRGKDLERESMSSELVQ